MHLVASVLLSMIHLGLLELHCTTPCVNLVMVWRHTMLQHVSRHHLTLLGKITDKGMSGEGASTLRRFHNLSIKKRWGPFQQKKPHMLWKHPTSYTYSCIPEFLLWQVDRQASQKSMDSHNEHFWPRDLDLWPMALTFGLELDILPLDIHAKIQVCMSVRSAVRVRRTDGHTDTQTDNAKTITPITSETWGVISWCTTPVPVSFYLLEINNRPLYLLEACTSSLFVDCLHLSLGFHPDDHLN